MVLESSFKLGKQNKDRPLVELLSAVNGGGSPDLSRTTPAERQTLLTWYLNNELPPKEKIDYLEEFLRYELLKEDVVLKLINDFDSKQRSQLAQFVGRLLEAGKYLQVFYECWNDLDDNTQARFIDKFTIQEPEKAFMVAPFVKLTEIKTEKFGRGGVFNDIRFLSITEVFFKDLSAVNQLIGPVLQYLERHPELREHKDQNISRIINPWALSTRGDYLHPEFNNIRDLIRPYLGEGYGYGYFILYPYLSKLIDLGLIEESKAAELLKREPSYHFFRNPQGKAAQDIEELRQTLKPEEFGKSYVSNDMPYVSPRKNALRIGEIIDNHKISIAKHILGNFKDLRTRFNIDPVNFLSNLIEADLPVFTEIESLGLTRNEVASILNKSSHNDSLAFVAEGFQDLVALLRWNRTQSEGPDLESLIVENINGFLRDGRYPTLIVMFNQILPAFTETNRRKIIEVVNTLPNSWLFNLNYAIENKVLPLEKILETSTERGHGIQYLERLNTLLYHSAILKKNGQPTEQISNLIEKARKIVLANPVFIFSGSTKGIVKQIFKPEELKQIIEGQLSRQPADPDLICGLITELRSEYIPRCKEIILKNPGIFIEINNERVNEIFSAVELSQLFLAGLDNIDLRFSLSTKILTKFLRAPGQFKRLITSLENYDSYASLAEIYKAIKTAESASDTKYSEKNLEAMRRDIKRLRKILASTRSVSAKEDISKEILKLENTIKEMTEDVEKRVADVKGFETDLQIYKDLIKEKLKNACRNKPFAVFNHNILEILNLEASEFIRANINDYVKINPEILLFRYTDAKHSSRLLLWDVLGDERYIELFSNHIKRLAFYKNHYSNTPDLLSLPHDLAEQIKKINPSIDILEQPEGNIYSAVIKRFENHAFYPVYTERLKAIEAEDLLINGSEPDPYKLLKGEFYNYIKNLALLESSHLAIKNKEAILALPRTQKKEILDLLIFVIQNYPENILDFDLAKDGYDVAKQKLRHLVLEHSKLVFEMPEIQSSNDSPLNGRTLNALSIYYDKRCRERQGMRKAFRTAITATFSGNYEAWRDWGDETDHKTALDKFKGERLIPANISLDQYQTWLVPMELDLKETFTYQLSDIRSGINDILSLAVIDGHIEDQALNVDATDLTNKYKELMRPMTQLMSRQSELNDKIKLSKKDKSQSLTEAERHEFTEIKDKIREFLEENVVEIKKIEALRYIERLKQLTDLELESRVLLLDKKRIPLAEAFKTLHKVFGDRNDFLSDLGRIRILIEDANKTIFHGGRVSKVDLKITDKVDLETAVLIGEEPVPSCQHYDGHGDNNDGLLSYITDPGVRIIQIFDENNKIIARAILRLMSDSEDKPQLFLERVYSANTHPKIKEAIINFAKQKAQALGTQLYTQEVAGNVKSLPTEEIPAKFETLYSYGSRSPFIYTDAGGGKAYKGVFKVDSARV